MAIPMRQIQHTIGNPRGSPVGVNMIQPDSDLCGGCIGAQTQAHTRRAHNIGVFCQYGRRETGRPRIVASLVPRHFRTKPYGTIFTTIHPAILR